MDTGAKTPLFVAIFIILATGVTLTGLVFRLEDRRMRGELLIQARMLTNTINANLISSLSGSDADLASPAYARLKEQLALACTANPQCRFTYLMGQLPNGDVFFFVDSEPSDSQDYSPPGQVYSEISKPMHDVFATGQEVVVGPASDRWGTWVSAAVPVVDQPTGKMIAVLGMDISARDWMTRIIYHSLPPAIVTVLIFVLLEGFLLIQRKNEREKIRLVASRMALQASEENFKQLFENMADGVAIFRAIDAGRDFVFVNLNKAGERISQVKRKDVIDKRMTEVFPSAQDIGLLETMRRVWNSGVSEYLPGVLYKDERIEHWTENYVLKLPSGLIVSIYSDITKRRPAEDEIRSLAKFPTENPSPVLRIAVDGRLIYVNPSALKYLADWHLQVAQAAPSMLRDLAFRALESGSEQHCDLVCGTQVYSFHITPIVEFGYVNLYGNDITELKKIEEELKRKTEFLEAQKEASLDGLLVIDENGQRLLINQRLLDLWQVPQDVINDTNDEALLQYVVQRTTNPREFLDKVHYLYAHKNETSEDEVEVKDGKVFDRYSSPVIDKNGKYFGRIWTFRDITERKMAEKKILEYAKRLGYLTKYANDLIILLDENFNLLEVNERAEDVYGYTRDELIGKHATSLRAPEVREMFGPQIAPVHEGGRVLFETVHVRKNGEKFQVEINVNTFDADKKRFYLAVIRDITERKKAQEKLSRALEEEIRLREITTSMLEDNKQIRARLEKSLEKLKETQVQLIHAEKMEAVGRMASGIAHEVKNPLGIILQGINYLEEKLPKEEGNCHDILGMMKDSIKRADGIVRAVLDFSRGEELKMEQQDINPVIKSSLELVHHKLRLNSVELVCEMGNDLPKTLLDSGKMGQVFVNLFNNATDAMPKGGKLYVRSYVSKLKPPAHKTGNKEDRIFMPEKEAIVVEVEDTGAGIEEGFIPKIFDPFFTTKNRTEGTGLGLSIVKSIIDLHQGSITVESQKDKGTKFTIVLKVLGGPGV
ncbi:MAG: PAS domain S-box protein [Candidatus Omnitrophica bacterium]|nr:PAS domain S-box protein [Candidatus Omnitrophota bacterium]